MLVLSKMLRRSHVKVRFGFGELIIHMVLPSSEQGRRAAHDD